MDTNSGIYLMSQVDLFDAAKVEFLERKGKRKLSREERKQKIKLKRPVFSFVLASSSNFYKNQ